MDSKSIFVGVPLTRGGLPKPAKPTLYRETGGYGFLAFIVGAVLAMIGWVANQGWTIASLVLFGEFHWTLKSAGGHIVLCLLGSLCTSIAFWAAFRFVFRSAFEDGEKEDEDSAPSFKRDVADATMELGELGFVVGYFLSQTFLTNPVYKPLIAFGIQYEEPSHVLNGATLVLVLVWVLSSKMRDYHKAAKRVPSKRVNMVGPDTVVYAQLV